MSFLEGAGGLGPTVFQGTFDGGSKLEDRKSLPQLETRVQRAVHVHPLDEIGDGAARCFSITASTMLMVKSVAVLCKEFFSTNFTHLAVMCSTLFTVFFGVGGIKMVIDGRRESKECLRTTGGKQADWKGALMTGNRVVEGTIMIGIAIAALVTSVIYIKHALGLNTPNYWVGDLLQSLSSLAFGVYTLFEWAGAFLESRKFRELRRELRASSGKEETDYAGAIAYLKRGVVVREAEKEGLTEDQVITLTKAKEDMFSLLWGRELMLNVRDLKAGDTDFAKKAMAIANEAKSWNDTRCRMVIVNFCLFTVAIAVVVGCVIFTGGIPVIASAIVMCVLSLVINVLNTRRIFMYFKSKELGKWDERLLKIGMVIVVASMTAAILLVGGGPIAIALFSVTGALILTLKGITLYKLRKLRKEREEQVEGAKKETLFFFHPSKGGALDPKRYCERRALDLSAPREDPKRASRRRRIRGSVRRGGGGPLRISPIVR